MDTLANAKTLETAGVPRQQAEAHAQALHATVETQVATKADTDALRAELKVEIADVRAELRLHRWILGFNTALLIAVVGKLFL
jgi:hypothetical protein